jgi:diguanylate cyclase (GGDEF)-like protein/PAS domain S-box-containing protein
VAGREQIDESLRVGRRALSAALTHVDEGLLVVRTDGTMTFASPAMRTLLGWDPDDLVGRNIAEYLEPDAAKDALNGLVRRTGRDGAVDGEQVVVRTAKGPWALLHYSVIAGESIGDLGDIVITLRDENGADPERIELTQSLLNETRLVRLASTFVGVDVDGFEAGLNAAVGTIAGLSLVTRVSVWQAVEDRVVRRAIWSASDAAPTTELFGSAPLGSIPILVRLEEVHFCGVEEIIAGWPTPGGQTLVDGGVRGVLAVPMIRAGRFTGFVMLEHTYDGWSFDATHFTTVRSAAAILAEAFARNEAERELVNRARTDILTGLPNRWAFESSLDESLGDVALGKAPGVAIALIDLDRFKIVNDSLGHDTGDHLLLEVAERLGAKARAMEGSSPEVGRLGGDEFLLLLRSCASGEEAADIVRQVLAALEPPFEVEGQPIALTASVGVVHVNDATANALELLRRADLAMYRAKALGGNRLVADDEGARARVAERLKVENDLREAVPSGRFLPYFQGEWDLASNRLVGAEALARWDHPSRGLVTAAEFIALAEESDLIVAIGNRILRKSCRALAYWREAGFEDAFILRVNLSARHLRHAALVDTIREVLSSTGMAAGDLCLELTESALLVDPAQAVKVLHRIRDLGCQLAVDDFGTGYSSMLYLRNLPLTSIKIDQAFVSGLPDSTADRAIVASVVQLAEKLGVSVTAEGVETEAQRSALLDLGCRRAQGYLLSLPEPGERFVERLLRRQAGAAS